MVKGNRNHGTGNKMQFWAHPNNATAEAHRILPNSAFCSYGLQQIRRVDNDYPEVMDCATPLIPDMLSGGNLVRIAPKKRTRGVKTPLTKVPMGPAPVKSALLVRRLSRLTAAVTANGCSDG